MPSATRLPPPDRLHWFDGAHTGWPVIRFIAHHRMRRHTPIPLYRVSALHLAMVAGGRLHLRLDGRRVTVEPGQAAILRPGCRFGHATAPNAGVVYYVGFRLTADAIQACPPAARSALEALRRRLGRGRGDTLAVSDAALAAADRCFRAVYDHAAPLTRFTRAGELLEHLALGLPAARRDDDRARVAPALAWLEREPAAAPSLADLAAACGLGRSQFAATFVRALGCPPHEWVNRRRVERSVARLVGGESVTAIALSLGFATSQHFATVFKRFMGVSPGRYRGRTA